MSKSKKPLIIGLIAGSVFLIAAVVILLLTLGSDDPLLGAWHNEALNQLVRFHDDGTVVIRTGNGDYEATYLFDDSKNEGVITLNETAIRFTVNGDEMLIMSGGIESLFTRGDMEIVVAQATPLPSATSAEASAETPSEVPSEMPSEMPSEALSEAPSETETDNEPSGEVSIDPDIIAGINPIGDALGSVIGTPVAGTWTQDNESSKLIFSSDGTCQLCVRTTGTNYVPAHVYNYTYNPVTGEGALGEGSEATSFFVEDDVLTWGERVYNRG